MKTIERGNVVEDIVTGFKGVATSKIVYLNGCVQFCVVPEVRKGDAKMPGGEYIDQGRLRYRGKGVGAQEEQGGDMKDCPGTIVQPPEHYDAKRKK